MSPRSLLRPSPLSAKWPRCFLEEGTASGWPGREQTGGSSHTQRCPGWPVGPCAPHPLQGCAGLCAHRPCSRVAHRPLGPLGGWVSAALTQGFPRAGSCARRTLPSSADSFLMDVINHTFENPALSQRTRTQSMNQYFKKCRTEEVGGVPPRRAGGRIPPGAGAPSALSLPLSALPRACAP